MRNVAEEESQLQRIPPTGPPYVFRFLAIRVRQLSSRQLTRDAWRVARQGERTVHPGVLAF
jgi:hypothetical protein